MHKMARLERFLATKEYLLEQMVQDFLQADAEPREGTEESRA